VQAVRIDSGDLGTQARAVRAIFDAAGCRDVDIVLSGSLDEHSIESLVMSDTPVDAFGIGTRLDVSEDAPSLDMAYKLEEYAGRARRKRSPGKRTWPGGKQVFREQNEHGELSGDTIALADEHLSGEPLLQEVMCNGRLVTQLPSLIEIQAFCRARVAELPAALRTLGAEEGKYPVRVSDRLDALTQALDQSGD
jgi:nicotinate phosphoribosyltransferase